MVEYGELKPNERKDDLLFIDNERTRAQRSSSREVVRVFEEGPADSEGTQSRIRKSTAEPSRVSLGPEDSIVGSSAQWLYNFVGASRPILT